MLNGGGFPSTHRSTSGYRFYLGSNLVSWSSKRQGTVSHSNVDVEYYDVANTATKTLLLHNLLGKLGSTLSKATIVYCNNISVVYLSTKPVQHQHTKHVKIDIHFIRDKVALGQIRVLQVPSSSQYANIFTKGLPTSLFHDFRSSLNIRCPAPIATKGDVRLCI